MIKSPTRNAKKYTYRHTTPYVLYSSQLKKKQVRYNKKQKYFIKKYLFHPKKRTHM